MSARHTATEDYAVQGKTPGEWRYVLAPPPKGTAAERLKEVQAKLYNAVDSILDGELAEKFPDTEGKRIVIQLDCRGLPQAEVKKFSDAIFAIPRYRNALAKSAFAVDIAFDLVSPQPFIYTPVRAVMTFAHTYERHLSALSMAGGYAFDSYSFGRIDHATTHIVFIAYLALAGIAIAISHRLESRGPETQPSERTRTILTAATQFALGCLLSGFCVFYLRSASLWASWPYLLVLAGVFIGNEFFKKYTTRFTFSLLLYFFALYSYAVFLVPVVIAEIGMWPFLASGILAVATFWFYTDVLAWLGRPRWRQVRLYVYSGVIVIAAAMNLFWFAKVLPPLPLALADAGVYHSAKKVGNAYQVTTEQQPWTTVYGAPPVIHLQPGEKLYLYASVFAPGRLATAIVHRWEWFDPTLRKWVFQSKVAFQIKGGRDGGYRAYSIKSKPKPGDWRVNITTGDGRPLGRVRFAVAYAPPPQPLQQLTLN
jgi:hypothetical protein